MDLRAIWFFNNHEYYFKKLLACVASCQTQQVPSRMAAFEVSHRNYFCWCNMYSHRSSSCTLMNFFFSFFFSCQNIKGDVLNYTNTIALVDNQRDSVRWQSDQRSWRIKESAKLEKWEAFHLALILSNKLFFNLCS